ncbi:hypothetical protein [Candidatus Viadribacter manganicus]|uniref:Uncharacterized protein n=1 Tax=Candidatus Viadribacter manganicus TaxID=1759059 RepID=A0A1B1AGT0_9PROT|nr:hypothetical protein [Candidatus Viadribacter manganicus]ANP45750.1 hypothetical protein ATE48_07365 [Candidatus Viadribacter manganicus]
MLDRNIIRKIYELPDDAPVRNDLEALIKIAICLADTGEFAEARHLQVFLQAMGFPLAETLDDDLAEAIDARCRRARWRAKSARLKSG